MYKITISDLKPKQVLTLLEHIPGSATIQVELVVAQTGLELPAARMNGATPLSMTGKTARPGTKREKILELFEKLEVKYGIGTVTRLQLREAVAKGNHSPTVIGQLLSQGYLKRL